MTDNRDHKDEPILSKRNLQGSLAAAMIMIIVLLFVYASAIILILISKNVSSELYSIIMGNVPVIVGIPMSAITASAVIFFFRQSERGVKFEILGLKLSGFSGRVILWILVFMSVVTAISILWNPIFVVE